MLYSSGSWEGWSDSGPLLFIYFQSHQQQQWGHGAFSASIKKLTHPPQRLLGVVGELWHEMGSTSTRQAQHSAQEQPQVNISEPVRQQQPQDVPWVCHITGPSAMTRSNKDQMHVLRSLCPGGPNFWLRCQIKKREKSNKKVAILLSEHVFALKHPRQIQISVRESEAIQAFCTVNDSIRHREPHHQ